MPCYCEPDEGLSWEQREEIDRNNQTEAILCCLYKFVAGKGIDELNRAEDYILKEERLSLKVWWGGHSKKDRERTKAKWEMEKANNYGR